ncbi:dehydrogenase/reductase SDR family member 1-like isoform X2 [Clavelina lepadiformis]|uniref:dehydrogenase/reductase SDR family member 1-like isoform X2 n=1 Tax=Clavelina lepadiformis TaxID=159417 RepID=UPI004041BB05
MMACLSGKVCVVTGASRGIGRGIALELVGNGAVCYITGRNAASLQLVDDEVKERGYPGRIIPVQCDHSKDEDVIDLFERVKSEQTGQLDLLVNNAYAAVELLTNNQKTSFWDLDPVETWDTVNGVGLRNHYICSVYATRMMVPRRSGLIINIGSLGGLTYMTTPTYGIGKAAKDRMAKDCAIELKKFNIAFVALWPGAVKTEMMVAEMDKLVKNKTYEWILKNAESSEYAGRCVVGLMKDPNIMKKSGQIALTTDLADEYNIKDVDGKCPNSMRSIRTMCAGGGAIGLANFLPGWLKLPTWLYKYLLSSFTAEQKKDPGKFA